MLSSHRWQVGLLGLVLTVTGCTVDQHKEVQRSTPIVKSSNGANESVAPTAAGNKDHGKTAMPIPFTGPVPSAPTSGGIAYYQDRQEKLLSERLLGTPVRMQRNADTIKLIVPGKIAFALNSEQIQPDFNAVLEGVAQILKEYSKTVVEIKGYTDSTGSFEHNQQLSERRAQSIGNYFIAHQIAAARIRSTGYGPRNPLAGNDTESGRDQNRRVEIELVPLP